MRRSMRGAMPKCLTLSDRWEEWHGVGNGFQWDAIRRQHSKQFKVTFQMSALWLAVTARLGIESNVTRLDLIIILCYPNNLFDESSFGFPRIRISRPFFVYTWIDKQIVLAMQTVAFFVTGEYCTYVRYRASCAAQQLSVMALCGDSLAYLKYDGTSKPKPSQK